MFYKSTFRSFQWRWEVQINTLENMIEKEKKLCWKDWVYGNLVSFMKRHENSKRNPVAKIFHDRNASWQISLWYKSWENTTMIAKWRCITKLGKSIRYHFVAGICKSASGSYTTRESEAVFKAKEQKERQCQSMPIQLFYCKNKGHVEKLCWKKTVEETVRAYSSNIAMATHQLDDEAEDSALLTISHLNTAQHHQC